MTHKHDGTATLVRDPTAKPIAAVVRVLGAKAQPTKFRLSSGSCVLGAAPDCDIVIDEKNVSRKHASLELAPQGVTVSDLGSRNGTFYLGQRFERMTLSLGAHVVLGAVEVAIEADKDQLTASLAYDADSYRGIVGVSANMRRIFAMIQRLEGSLVTTLVLGESGVGKELIARALHEGSSVGAGPFVAVNCGAVPRDLVSSELFGHKRGAFTGAVEGRRGAFELAHGGTLFLDEIGELPLDVQPVLLRALETGEIRPVGAEVTQKVSVRVVAATNRDLEAESRAGRFREDLFYRLAVVSLAVPPLRERREDIEPIARRVAQVLGGGLLPSEVIEELKARSWPGNVRELRNAIQAYTALGVLPDERKAESSSLDAAVSDFVDVSRPYAEQKDALTDRFTRAYLQALLAHTNGNQSAAAKAAALDRTYLGKLLVKYGLSKA
jgi:DNA-binding NtrC family response regulator